MGKTLIFIIGREVKLIIILLTLYYPSSLSLKDSVLIVPGEVSFFAVIITLLNGFLTLGFLFSGRVELYRLLKALLRAILLISLFIKLLVKRALR